MDGAGMRGIGAAWAAGVAASSAASAAVPALIIFPMGVERPLATKFCVTGDPPPVKEVIVSYKRLMVNKLLVKIQPFATS